MSIISQLLKSKFERTPRIVLPEDCGVMTGTDRDSFRGMQLLHWSLSLSHATTLVVIDCGMTGEQRDWCYKQRIPIQIVPQSNRIFPEEQWDKPVFISHSPFAKTLWLDSDAVVTGNLNEVFDKITQGPLLLNDYFQQSFNDKSLYKLRPVLRKSPYVVSGGVIGLDLNRDFRILDVWKKITEVAYADERLRALFSNKEQGTFLWAVEAAGCVMQITNDARFGIPIYPLSRITTCACNNTEDLLNKLLPQIIIQRFQGGIKPWSHWEEYVQFEVDPDDILEKLTKKVRIFVTGDEETVPTCFDLVNLDSLPLGIHQNPIIGDNRIFLSDLAETMHEPYLGCVTSSFNLDQIRQRLSLDQVFVKSRTQGELHWKQQLDTVNPGIMAYIDEIERYTELKAGDQTFFGNEFVCHRYVYREFLAHWRKVYHYLLDKYQNHFSINSVNPQKTASFVYEAITSHYFSTRKDLEIVQIG